MKVLVLFSGGLDSSTCLALAVHKYGNHNVIALSMSYGQKHSRELQSAKAVADYYNVKHLTYDLSKIFETSDCSLLMSNENEIPKESYKSQLDHTHGNPVTTYVPFRNGLFLSAATSLAYSLHCDLIYYGIHKDDAAGNAYPDCSVKFNEYMSKAINEGTGQKIEIYAPFVNLTKAEIVRIGLDLHVPYELTWSCYEGGEKPCGKCGTCIDRENAFRINGMEDPLYDVVGK